MDNTRCFVFRKGSQYNRDNNTTYYASSKTLYGIVKKATKMLGGPYRWNPVTMDCRLWKAQETDDLSETTDFYIEEISVWDLPFRTEIEFDISKF